MKPRTFFFVIMVVCAWTALIRPPARAESSVRVVVSIAPQKYFVSRIGGDRVEVLVMVPPGASPERYEPKPRQMVALSGARIYFACGIPFEQAWLDRIVAGSPHLRVIHTEEGIERRWMASHGHDHAGEADSASEDAEEEGAHHHHAGQDPHIWLSPALVMQQARHILNGLLNADPDHRDGYEAGYRDFIKEVVDLDLSIRNVFWGKGSGLSFMVFHPAWGYFADAYGLKQIPVEMEGKEPKAQEMQQLVSAARDRGIKVIFVQPQFSTRSAQTIAEAIGGQVMAADPLAEDWASNLQRVADAFASAVR